MSLSPVSRYAQGLETVAPSEAPLEGAAPAPAPSTAVVVWTPPPEPSAWQRLMWSMFGRPEPGLDGRFDHVLVDASMITMPKDQRLAAIVLGLAKGGRLSVKGLFETLASDGAGSIKPSQVDGVRKSIRLAAEKLEQRSPGAKLADAARVQLDVLRRDLDALDSLRTEPYRLLQRAEGGVASLLAPFDGHHSELQALLAGAASAAGAEHDKIEIIRAGLAGLVARRDAVGPSVDQQLAAIHTAAREHKTKAAEAARADEARVAVITALSPAERARYGERLEQAAKIGARFSTPTGSAVPAHDVLAHLAWHGVEVSLGGPGLFSQLLRQPTGPSQTIRDLTSLEDLLKRLGVPR
ncbi:MAG: hypothetical protein ACAI38_13445 [Myxococcota bacterium]